MPNVFNDSLYNRTEDSIETLARLITDSQGVDTIDSPFGTEVHIIDGDRRFALDILAIECLATFDSAHGVPNESTPEPLLHKKNAPIYGAFQREF